MIFVNFKSSLKGTGENALRIVKALNEAQKETDVPIILAPHTLDLYPVSEVWEGEVWTQHADYDRGTGRNQVELLQSWNKGKIKGTFVNHSEHKFEGYNLLAKVVRECEEFAFKTLLFAGSETEIQKMIEMQMKPTYLAYEPPELVGSQDTSVAKAKPDDIKKAAELASQMGVPLIVGAGVKDRDDVLKSVELGAVGVAVSSAVINAEDPKKEVLELASGFKSS
jgi:triosephosphate isomerase (TIM)